MMIPTMEKGGTRGKRRPPSPGIVRHGADHPALDSHDHLCHTAGSVSIAALFLAGAVPGVLIGLGLMTWAYFHAKKHIKPVPMPKLSFKEKAYRIADGLAGLFTIFIILGGSSPDSSRRPRREPVASLYAIILCCGIYRETKWSELPKILFECCQVNAVVLFLVATSSVFTWILTYENLPRMLANTVFAITDNKILLLIVINIFLLIVGCLVDLTPAVIMLTRSFCP